MPVTSPGAASHSLAELYPPSASGPVSACEPPPARARAPLRIVIADDAVLLREGLIRLLAEDGHQVLAAVGDGRALVDAVLTHRPDVSIVDVRMPPTHTDEGLRAAITARSRLPGAPMLVLSQYVEASYAAELLSDGSGAVGYLLKDRVAEVEEFLDALSRVAAGATILDPQVVAHLLAGQRREHSLAALTARERQLLGLMAQGHSNTAIARQLVVSASAVEKHIGNVFAKLGLPPDDSQHRRRPEGHPLPRRHPAVRPVTSQPTCYYSEDYYELLVSYTFWRCLRLSREEIP